MSATIIKLSNCDKHTIVDADTARMLQGRNVWLDANGYAQVSRKGRGGHCTKLHQLVLAAKPGLVRDHINGDKLDNRASNLRCISQRDNCRNRHCPPRSVSGFRSVYRHKRKWRICVFVNYKQYGIKGWFSPVVASIFADDFKRTLHGQYAALNYTRVVYREQLRELLDSTAGTFFRVAFSRRSDGTLRVMHCRTGVKKGLVGGPLAYQPQDKNLYVVYDLARHAYRAIPLERVLTLRVRRENIKVIERTVSWAS